MLLLCGAFPLAAVAPAWVVERLQPYGLELATFPGTGRGLRTTRTREAGELLFSVDNGDVLIAERLVEDHVVLRAAAQAAVAEGGGGRPLSDELLLSLYLTLERSEYTAALPPLKHVECAVLVVRQPASPFVSEVADSAAFTPQAAAQRAELAVRAGRAPASLLRSCGCGDTRLRRRPAPYGVRCAGRRWRAASGARRFPLGIRDGAQPHYKPRPESKPKPEP